MLEITVGVQGQGVVFDDGSVCVRWLDGSGRFYTIDSIITLFLLGDVSGVSSIRPGHGVVSAVFAERQGVGVAVALITTWPSGHFRLTGTPRGVANADVAYGEYGLALDDAVAALRHVSATGGVWVLDGTDGWPWYDDGDGS